MTAVLPDGVIDVGLGAKSETDVDAGNGLGVMNEVSVAEKLDVGLRVGGVVGVGVAGVGAGIGEGDEPVAGLVLPT